MIKVEPKSILEHSRPRGFITRHIRLCPFKGYATDIRFYRLSNGRRYVMGKEVDITMISFSQFGRKNGEPILKIDTPKSRIEIYKEV